MLQITTIKCPCCFKMVGFLEFWKQYGDKYYHICTECMKKELTQEDILNIGFMHGVEFCRKQISNFVDKV